MVLVKSCEIVLPLPLAEPVMLPTGETTRVQLYEVPPTLLLKTTDVDVPEHMVCGDGVAIATGKGFTVTIAFTGVPVQPPALAETLYVAVPGFEAVAESTCAIAAPDDAEAPETPD